MSVIRWGIIGCGDVTERKSGPGFQQADGSRLAAVMRRNGDLAQDYAKRHQVPKWYDNAEELICDPEVDAVYIATPPAYHKPYTLAAATAGKPVYVEKPMALTYKECLEMIDACQDGSLFVAYYRRALPLFLKIKELLDSKVIGNVRLVTTTHYRKPLPMDSSPDKPWRVDPNISGGGYFHDVASHTLDIIDFLLGPIETVEGYASNQAGLYTAADTVTSTYRLQSGVHGTGAWSFTSGNNYEMNEIVGDTGKLSFSTFGTGVTLTLEGKQTCFSPDTPNHIQQPLIQTVVNQLLGKGTCPSTGRSGARTSWVMDEMTK